MIIVLEGPDGCGKTNIGMALSEDMGIPYFKMNTEHDNWRKGRFKEALQFDQTYLAQFLKQVECSVIIDRAYPSEWVYSQVYNRETDMKVLREVDDMFASIGANIIVTVRSDYSVNEKDELIENEMLPILHKKYLEFLNWTKCKSSLIYVDSYNDDLDLELPAIKAML